MRTLKAVLLAAMLAVLSSNTAIAQQLYGQRLQSIDGQWTLPTATRLLGSTDDDHVSRGSINSWDLSASIGSPVFAAAPGRVKTSGCYLYENRITPNLQGYGCSVQVDHGGGLVSQYGHCKEGTLYVKAGGQVTANSLLCQVGTTGQTSWPHVHFTILRNGSPVRIASVFDIRQMHYCKFCKATNDPSAPIAGYIGSAQGQQSTGYDSLGMQMVRALGGALAQTDPVTVQMGLAAAIMAIMLALWLSPNWVRVAIVSGLVSVTCAITVALLFMPTQAAPVQTGQAAPGGWQQAYKVTIGSEGFSCTNDGAYTMGGVTQGTYDAWRMSQGLGHADVCRNLTEAQRQSIFVQRYWVASGADKLPANLAITYVDHAFNAGVGAARQGLAACGLDVSCFNRWRVQDYQGKSNCRLYCTAWINRVNKVRSITE
jgi:murein DD-endopeptidase MepM/ murein hydrolase activator NlpD